ARVSSILDAVGQEYAEMEKKVGVADRARLDQHLTYVRQVETSLTSVTSNPVAGACVAPGMPMATAGASDNVPEHGSMMRDLAVLALAWDLTRVLTFQWLEPLAFNKLPWLGYNEQYHFYQHDGGYHPIELTIIETWFMQQLAYFVGKLDAIKECSGRLL